MQMTEKDYIFCEDCNEYVDFWRYDHDIEDAGHKGHKWRYVNKKELEFCIKDCIDDGCLRRLPNGELVEDD